MNKVIILRKIQAKMKTFNSAFINHFSLSLNREKRVVMRAMKKKLPKHSFADLLLKIDVLKNFASFTGKHPCVKLYEHLFLQKTSGGYL